MSIQRDEIVDEISVCIVCMFDHANGEYPGDPADRPADEPKPWALLRFGYDVTMGGTHAEECPNRNGYVASVDCDCDSLGFRQSSCEGCGNHLHGDRWKFTLWRATLDYARAAHAGTVRRARDPRTDRSKYAAQCLSESAQWRGYIRDRHDEDRRIARMMARSAA